MCMYVCMRACTFVFNVCIKYIHAKCLPRFMSSQHHANTICILVSLMFCGMRDFLHRLCIYTYTHTHTLNPGPHRFYTSALPLNHIPLLNYTK